MLAQTSNKQQLLMQREIFNACKLHEISFLLHCPPLPNIPPPHTITVLLLLYKLTSLIAIIRTVVVNSPSPVIY